MDSGNINDRSKTSTDTYRSLTNYRSTEKQMTVTVLGKIKTLAGLDRNERIFLILCVSCLFAIIGLTVRAVITSLDKSSPDFVLAILLLINAAFCLFYTIHGVLREREFELYLVILAILIVTVYVIVNFGRTFPSTKSSSKLALFVLIVVFVPAILRYAWVVGQGFGYLIFKTVGAGAEMQDMYRNASRFSGLLKFDLQLAMTLIVLTIEDGGHMSYFCKLCFAVGVPLQILASLVGWIAMRTEQLLLVWCFLPLCCAEPVFIAYRISQFCRSWNHYTDDSLEMLTYSFIIAAFGAVIVRCLLLFALYVVVKNFGRGLKFRVFQIPVNPNDPPVLPSKRHIKKCCGMVCCGPFG